MPELKTNECPASFVSAASQRLIEILLENQYVKESTGAVMFGMDSAEWDPRLFDAVVLIAEEQQRVKDQAEDLQAITGS